MFIIVVNGLIQGDYMNVIPTDLIAEKIFSGKGKTLGTVNEVVVHYGQVNQVFLLVNVKQWLSIESHKVVVPLNVLDALDSGGLRFSLAVELFKKHEFKGDHRELQKETDVFFKRVARTFDVWRSSEDHLSNSCLYFEPGAA